MGHDDVTQATQQAVASFADREDASVEEIQDAVEDALIKSGFTMVAKAYIRYRTRHEMHRQATADLMKSYSDLLFSDAKDMDLKRDNANINTDAPMGVMLKLGAEGSKCWAKNYGLPEKFAQMHNDNIVHLHDLDFSFITFNCCQIDLLKVLHGGFNTGHGFLREPNSIRSYAALACIVIQSNQNDMFGGQSISAWDYAMAEGIRKTFRRVFFSELKRAVSYTMANGKANAFLQYFKDLDDSRFPSYTDDKAITFEDETEQSAFNGAFHYACKDIEDETHQAMEAAVHNFNSLHSRAGSQVPFSSINYGMDTTAEGRLATKMTLRAIWEGLGNGETPIFPISVFTMKAGINYNPGDPNYDLFQLACKVSAKRLFPNFCSIDAPYNLKYYKPGDYRSYAVTMGCRTKVMSNINGPEETSSRGNFAFTTINLPMLALAAKGDVARFFELFDKYITMSKEYLEYRYQIIAHKKVKNFPFLMGQGIWMDSEKLGPEDEISEVLKHASLSIGFCGLAECLVALTGHHHGEDAASQELGLKIIGHLREMTDRFTQETHQNWSTFATPAESTAGDFARANQQRFGKIKGVTDREYLTNSMHVPVYYHIKAIDKIRIEAPYHALCNAGVISYVEMDGDPSKNLPAFETIIRAMHDNNMSYFSVNHPVDRDSVCGYTGLIENECPHCHRKEGIETHHLTLPRI
jgi:ribonucleoside-triphosphate reductase